MLSGHVDRIDRLAVSGWAAEQERPASNTAVYILVDGVRVAEVFCDLPRTDLKSSFSWLEGRGGFNYTFPTSIQDDANHWVEVRFSRTNELLPNGEKLLPGKSDGSLTLTSSLKSHVDAITRNYVTGWIANPDVPDKSHEILVTINGIPRQKIQANLHRADLTHVFPGSTGKYAFRFECNPPLSMSKEHKVEVAVKYNGQSISLGKRIIPAIGQPPAAGPVPILVTSTGRSGSSLLMARLSQHPEIAVAGRHPFEVEQISYYALALRTLASEADHIRSFHPDTMAENRHMFSVGFNPYNNPALVSHPLLEAYWNNTLPHELAKSFKQLICDYYEVIRMISGKPVMRFFAEKARPNDTTRQSAAMMFGKVKEIALTRDPRDLVCSYRSFWNSAPESSVPTIVSQLRDFMTLKEKAAEDILFVRYEDLTLQPGDTMGLIHDFLGVTHKSSVQSSGEADAFRRHGTSKSPTESIGRWRSDLTSEELKICNQAFEPFLKPLGYEL